MTIKEISNLRKTQSNWHCTSLPLYLVEKKVREYGLDPTYCEEYVYVDSDGDEVDDEELISRLEEAEHDLCGTEESRGYSKVYYRDRWEFVTLFFTEKNAREFIERNKHRATEMRVYVDSAHRNEELKEIIKFLENYNEEGEGTWIGD